VIYLPDQPAHSAMFRSDWIRYFDTQPAAPKAPQAG